MQSRAIAVTNFFIQKQPLVLLPPSYTLLRTANVNHFTLPLHATCMLADGGNLCRCGGREVAQASIDMAWPGINPSLEDCPGAPNSRWPWAVGRCFSLTGHLPTRPVMPPSPRRVVDVA